jgi:hypothetical protein
MKHLHALTLLGILLLAGRSSAQDTCRYYWLPNPSWGPIYVYTVEVLDTVNFSVEPIKPLPHRISQNESFDVTICIRARDGRPHSTIVRYTHDHGSSAEDITMTAPIASAVEKESTMRLRLHPPMPNPAASTISIDPGYTLPENVSTEIVDLSGRIVVAGHRPAISDGRLQIDVGAIPNGRYLLRVIAPGRSVDSWPIVVRR